MKAFFGWCLIAVGGLVALTCGLCTMSVAMMGVGGSAPPNLGGGGVLMVALLFGGPPTALGIGLFVLGLQLIKKSRPSAGGDLGG